MRNPHWTLWIGSFAVVFLPQAASGQSAPPPTAPPQPQPEHVVVGESCTVDVDRDGASVRLEGEFVKYNHRWIVLRQISESRNDVSVPVSPKIPFVTRKQAEIGTQTEYLWIPPSSPPSSATPPPSGTSRWNIHWEKSPPLALAAE